MRRERQTENKPEEEEEEENPATNPVRGIHGWAKENAARARSERAGNLSGYVIGISNEPKEYEEEENESGNCKQPATNPVGGSHGWENENVPTLAPSRLKIHGGMTGRFTKQATMLPVEGNTPSAGTKVQELHKVLMGGNPMLQIKSGEET